MFNKQGLFNRIEHRRYIEQRPFCQIFVHYFSVFIKNEQTLKAEQTSLVVILPC